MTASDSNVALNRLLMTLNRSFAMYLMEARPWTRSQDEAAMQAIEHLVNDLNRYCGQIIELLLDRRVPFHLGEYPTVFTDVHDLSLDYLMGELVHYLKQEMAIVDECLVDMSTDLTARALAEEIRGNLRGHLENLEALVQRQPVAA